MLLNSLNPYTYLFFVVHYLYLVNSYPTINQISEIHP